MSGFIALDRALCDHHIVGAQNPKRLAAWVWMLMEARWRDGKVWINDAEIHLERGQFACSIRRMAEQTPLSKKEVETFLKVLERAGMVQKTGTPSGTPRGKGVTVVTICNYDVYQNSDRSSGTQGEGQKGHQGDTKGTLRGHDRTKITNKQSKYISADGGEAFSEFWELYPRKVGKVAAEKAYAKAAKITDHETLMAGVRKYAELRNGQGDKFTAHAATWLRNERWSDEISVDDTPSQPKRAKRADEMTTDEYLALAL